MQEWCSIRSCTVRKLLSSLRENQATGPDKISARFLKRLAAVLDVPLAMLARRIFNEGVWPDLWRNHRIAPLFKRGSPYRPGQYRGIHLTCILSKCVERYRGGHRIRVSGIYTNAQFRGLHGS